MNPGTSESAAIGLLTQALFMYPAHWQRWAVLWTQEEGRNDGKQDRQCKGKGKAVPLQAWSGPEGSRKLRFPDFMTTAQDGGKVDRQCTYKY